MNLPEPYSPLNSQNRNIPKTEAFMMALKSVVHSIFYLGVRRLSPLCTPSTSMAKFLFYISKQRIRKGAPKYLNSTSSDRQIYPKQAPSHRMNRISLSSELTICLKRK